MMDQQPKVVLADTFPAKAHLLITYLTQTKPTVCTFSPDGTSFYVYDQAQFAQTLPQYFKHNNYGSFVRQLNLYGFNSSRLKDNNDVVEWKHDNFHRDRKDLVNNIKRTKKSKSSSTKPSHVHVDRRASSPGMPSSSDDASSSLADSEQLASTVGKVLDRKVSGTDYEWLAAEFSILKRQNESLERKLDTLLQITLRINPGIDLEQTEHLGEKRRRTNAVAGGYSTGEELKVSDADHLEIEPVPYINDTRKMPHQSPNTKNDNDDMGDSLTAFIDIMMNEDESKAFEEDDGLALENIDNERMRASATSNTATDEVLNNHEDELMEEALIANLPESTLNTDGDLFGIDENEPTLQNSSEGGIVAITNAAADKANGPEPIEVISSIVPTYDGLGDIEEANMPIGVQVISARAELVEEDDRNVGNRLSDMRHNKRVVCLLSVLVLAVVAFVVTIPAVIVTQRKNNKNAAGNKRPPCGGKGTDRHDCRPQDSSEDGDFYDDEYYDFPIRDKIKDKVDTFLEKKAENEAVLEDSNTSTTTDASISPQPQLALQSVKYKDHSFSDDEESISLTIHGVAYECTNA